MTPVDQSLLVAEHGHGDCLRACVATVLDLSLWEVPDFALFGPNWMWALVMFAECDFDGPFDHTGVWIANGPSPRGVRHSVVYDDTGMVHDPHPTRAGLLSIDGSIQIKRVRPDVAEAMRKRPSSTNLPVQPPPARCPKCQNPYEAPHKFRMDEHSGFVLCDHPCHTQPPSREAASGA
jgi:hypothetical protein